MGSKARGPERDARRGAMERRMAAPALPRQGDLDSLSRRQPYLRGQLARTMAVSHDRGGGIDGVASRSDAHLDLESAHDRPSWVDLLTPAKLRQFLSIPQNPTIVVSDLFRSGDPGLKPRRLTGALASAGITVARGFRLDFSGTLRRVTDDFGWDVSVDTVGGSYTVTSTARARGSGWLSHAACGWEFRGGPIRTRGVGWIRGGSDSLSPRSGSPPRSALDAAFDVRIVLFQGDLPLRFGFESHARGPRRGLAREPGQVTWDGSLSADFGS